jgi:hypothetical protein
MKGVKMVAQSTSTFAVSRPKQATISFFEPHKALASGPAARLLRQLTLDSPIEGERRVALAVCCGALSFRRGAAIIEGGLVYAVKIVLEYHGFEVSVVEACWGHYKSPAKDMRLDWDQTSFAALLEGRGRALVAARSFEQQVDLLGVVCQRFPHATISVAVKNNAAALSVVRLLSKRVPQIMYTGMRDSGDNSPQVSLISVWSFVAGSRCDYFVALGEAATLNRKVQEQVSPWRNCIRVAITDRPLQSLRERDRVHVESTYGPCLLDFSNPPPLVPVYAAIVPSAGSRARDGLRGLERKLKHVTRNSGRNRQIALLADRLRRHDATCLRVAGIANLDLIVEEPAEPGKLRVAIVVESRDHALRMQQLLPGWSVVSDTSSAGPLGIEGDAAIVTLPAACAVGLTTEVVVYAAGTGDRWIKKCGGQMALTGCMQLVVDFADDFDSVARSEIYSRVEDYRARRWIIHWQGHDGRPVLDLSNGAPAGGR